MIEALPARFRTRPRWTDCPQASYAPLLLSGVHFGKPCSSGLKKFCVQARRTWFSKMDPRGQGARVRGLRVVSPPRASPETRRECFNHRTFDIFQYNVFSWQVFNVSKRNIPHFDANIHNTKLQIGFSQHYPWGRSPCVRQTALKTHRIS